MRRPNRQPVLGRRAELARCEAFIEDCLASTLGLLVVVGEAGIGKTTLLEASIDDAAVEPCHFVGEEGNRSVAFGATSHLVGATINAARAEAVTEAIVDSIEEIAIAGRLVIAIDDLQWIDDASLGVFRAMLHRLRDLPVAVMVAVRGGRDDDVVAALADHVDAPVIIELGPLAEEVVDELVRARCDDHLAGALRAARTGRGNPLLVTELVDAAIAQHVGGLSLDLGDGGSRDSTLRATLERRVRAAGEPVATLLAQVAAIGISFSAADAVAVLGGPAARTRGLLADALAAGLLVDDGDRLRFRHPSIHAVCYAAQPAALRALHHLAAARALMAAGRPAPVIGNQYLLAREALGSDDVPQLIDVASALIDPQPGLAVELLSIATELRPPHHLASPLALGLMDALFAANRFDDVVARAGEELDVSNDPTHRFEVLKRRHLALGYLGRMQERRALLEDALHDDDLDPRSRAWWLTFLVESCWILGDTATAEATLDESLQAARAVAEPALLARALGPGAWVALTRGDVMQAVEYAREAQRVLERATGWVDTVHTYVGSAFSTADMFDDARRAHRAGVEMDRRFGIVATTMTHQIGFAGADMWQGRLDDARAAVDAAFLAVADGTGAPVAPIQAHGFGALIATHLGAQEDYERHVAAARARLERGELPFGVNFLRLAEVFQGLATGDVEGPFAALRVTWDLIAARGYQRPWREALPVLTRLSLRHGLVEQAQVYAADATLGGARAPSVLSAVATAKRCEGIVGDDHARIGEAADDLERCERPLFAGCALEEAAEVALRVSDHTAAARYLERARTIYVGLGADGGIARVLRIQEGRAPSRRSRPRSGWPSVTPSELAVVELVAAGHSNPTIAAKLALSRHTVESHLKQVYRKLGLSSRVALASAYLTDPGAPRG